jgi:hypothetical protein
MIRFDGLPPGFRNLTGNGKRVIDRESAARQAIS